MGSIDRAAKAAAARTRQQPMTSPANSAAAISKLEAIALVDADEFDRDGDQVSGLSY